MKTMFITVGTVLNLAAATVVPASASVVNWTLSDVTFQDGGTASGAFSIDSATGKLTTFDVTTTDGATLAGYRYEPLTSRGGPSVVLGVIGISMTSLDIRRYLNLSFQDPLTVPGVNSIRGGVGSHSYECDDCFPYRFVTGGVAIGDTVPEPVTWTTMVLGFGTLGTALRRTRRYRASHE